LHEVVNIGPDGHDAIESRECFHEDAFPSQSVSLSLPASTPPQSAPLEITISFTSPITMVNMYITSTVATVETYVTTTLKPVSSYISTVKGNPFKLDEDSPETYYDAGVSLQCSDITAITIKCLSLKKRRQVHIYGITIPSPTKVSHVRSNGDGDSKSSKAEAVKPIPSVQVSDPLNPANNILPHAMPQSFGNNIMMMSQLMVPVVDAQIQRSLKEVENRLVQQMAATIEVGGGGVVFSLLTTD
jgi:hypothetical protein